jgi:hypothetical protein
MLDKFTTTEEGVKEVLIDLMTERLMSMSVGIKAASMRAMQASPSIARGPRPFWPSTEKRTKNKDDLANAKIIPTILPDYIPPLAGRVNRDSMLRDFEYTIFIVYLLKGIRTI